jgi:uncharacterized protein YbcI
MAQTHERVVAPGRQRPGPAGMAVANAVVHLVRQYTGRGPTQARAEITGDLCTIVLADMLTKAEKKLASDGEAEMVLDMRREFQLTMRDDLIAAVEGALGRKVVAFMSDNHLDPDLAIEVFVLEPVLD